ncbi:MAG TPA: type II toxin-antitoxin system HigB family toxin [Polyangiaceae bacterium]
MRDDKAVFETLWGREKWADAKGTYLLRLAHCPHAMIATKVSDLGWQEAWADVFIDYMSWESAGEPEGFVWGVCWSTPYPGLTYIDGSQLAEEWSSRFNKSMHEVSKGNRYRVIAQARYAPLCLVYIRFIGTHAEYAKIDARSI